MKTYHMLTHRSTKLVLFTVAALLLALVEPARAQTNYVQRNFKHKSLQDVGGFAQVRLMAERGNAEAQLQVADAFFENRLTKSALDWYLAAADQGQTEAAFKSGHLLLFGAGGATVEEQVAANPAKGLPYTYMAATNRHPLACYDMGAVTRDGISCATNLVNAYVWFTGCPEAANEKKLLTLKLSTADIATALNLARDMKAGRCPELKVQALAEPSVVVDITLKLSGISYSPQPRGRLAIINNRTIGEGETMQFNGNDRNPVAVTCRHISQTEVEVVVGRESEPRILSTAPDLAYYAH